MTATNNGIASDGISTDMIAPDLNAATSRCDVFPDFAISPEEAKRRVRMLQEFVRDQMVEGEDYGIIPGTGNKPTLFKPGAEKLNLIFGLAPIVEITQRSEDWTGGFVSYEVKVTLMNKRSANVEAEGVGLCNSKERRYKNQDAPNIANTILKMAKKRALIDATLSATRASGVFTQDLEDIELEREDDHQRSHPQQRPPQNNRQNAPQRAQNSPNHTNARPAQNNAPAPQPSPKPPVSEDRRNYYEQIRIAARDMGMDPVPPEMSPTLSAERAEQWIAKAQADVSAFEKAEAEAYKQEVEQGAEGGSE